MTIATAADLLAYVIITDGGTVDQICYSKAEATKEAKDLRAMGCTVKVKPMSWSAAEEYADRKRGY